MTVIMEAVAVRKAAVSGITAAGTAGGAALVVSVIPVNTAPASTTRYTAGAAAKEAAIRSIRIPIVVREMTHSNRPARRRTAVANVTPRAATDPPEYVVVMPDCSVVQAISDEVTAIQKTARRSSRVARAAGVTIADAAISAAESAATSRAESPKTPLK